MRKVQCPYLGINAKYIVIKNQVAHFIGLVFENQAGRQIKEGKTKNYAGGLKRKDMPSK